MITYGKLNNIDIFMDNEELNRRYNILFETILAFSNKHNIFIQAGHSWYSSPIFNNKNIIIEGSCVVNEFWISIMSKNPEFDIKCFDKKMCFMGINIKGNAYLENYNSETFYEVKCDETYIEKMLFHFMFRYLKLKRIPKTYCLTDFIVPILI
jgi:hypothetical protein